MELMLICKLSEEHLDVEKIDPKLDMGWLSICYKWVLFVLVDE